MGTAPNDSESNLSIDGDWHCTRCARAVTQLAIIIQAPAVGTAISAQSTRVIRPHTNVKEIDITLDGDGSRDVRLYRTDPNLTMEVSSPAIDFTRGRESAGMTGTRINPQESGVISD
jgi:hypothetical protein